MRNDRDNIIVKITTEFALMMIAYCDELEARRKFVIANQLLRSATSIAANVREAQNAESTDDFIHKFKIAAKESDETDLWLYLCQHAPTYPNPEAFHFSKLNDIQRVISKIVSSTKRKRRL